MKGLSSLPPSLITLFCHHPPLQGKGVSRWGGKEGARESYCHLWDTFI